MIPNYILIDRDRDPEPVPTPQFRKRVKGFEAHCSWGNGDEELIEVPAECPNISTVGYGVVSVEEC